MTMKQIAPMAGVTTVMLLFCWAAFAFAADAPAQSNPPQAAGADQPAQPAGEVETFEYKEKTPVFDDWFGIFSEGTKVGWAHVAISTVKRGDATVFLYESTEHVQFAADKVRDTEIKALYAEGYQPIAYRRTDEVGTQTSQLYVSNNYVNGGLKGFVVKRTVGTDTSESTFDLAGELPMYDFAAVCYFRKYGADNPKLDISRTTIDMQSFVIQRTRIVMTPPKKEKIAGGEAEVRALDASLKRYYFNNNFEPVFVIDFPRGLHMIRGLEAEAKAEGKPEPGYVADPNIMGNLYNGRADGFSVRRPSTDWAITVTKEGAMPVIWMKGVVSEGAAFGAVLAGLPAGSLMPAVSARLRQIATKRAEQIPWKLEFGDATTVQQSQPGYAREDCPVKASSGILALEGTCAVIMNGNVAIILMYLFPAGTLEKNKDEIAHFLDDVRVTPVGAGKNPLYENKGKRFRIEFSGRLWAFTESDQGLTFTNPWYGALGSVMTQEVPKETKLADFAGGVLQTARNMGQAAADENGVHTTILDQNGKSVDAIMFDLAGPMPQSGGTSHGRLYVAINNGIGYAVYIALPEGTPGEGSIFDAVMKGFKLLKP